jgi:hypothetical protein
VSRKKCQVNYWLQQAECTPTYPQNLTGLLTRLSQEARAALPQNCSMTNLHG